MGNGGGIGWEGWSKWDVSEEEKVIRVYCCDVHGTVNIMVCGFVSQVRGQKYVVRRGGDKSRGIGLTGDVLLIYCFTVVCQSGVEA